MIIVGDLHGGYPEMLSRIQKLGLENTTFIQVGDWGLGFQPVDHDKKALAQVDKFLQKTQNHLYIIRGNHDNKWFWDHRDQLHLKNVHLIQDYEVRTIEQHKILFIGGGISIDRTSRILNKNYWADETVVYNEPLLKAACANGIDMVISHIAPREVWPHTYNPLVLHFIAKELTAGNDLSAELKNERLLMSQVYQHVCAAGCRMWYYGHYHESHVEEKEGIVFRCVSIQEMYDTNS
ncbi:metallophosphoesterase [Chitinophaga sp. HK235]|uniref:metallophosphoesterase n=1 Tax=Chitinophaga sp. HK235 TaxID=2952571 RepID=UPI001BAA4DE2|nr:metallophosphoesterase [Chitinophaga sp. HK235]